LALERLQCGGIDLVLLDVMMPEMDGFDVLALRRQDARLAEVPVIVLSAQDELDSAVRCIELGADDYLLKPYESVLLRARIGAALERKQLRDREKEYVQLLAWERERSERLLRNMLPEPIAARLKDAQTVIADTLAEVSVLFADLVGFTALSLSVSPHAMVAMLNRIFSAFDSLAAAHGLEKIKTIGDGYEVIAGAPLPRADHPEAVAEMALGMQAVIRELSAETGWPLDIRIGIDTGGPVVAGVIGHTKYVYEVWGDCVNTASRMESHGLAGCIQVTAAAYTRLRERYTFTDRGTIDVKGKGTMSTYLLTGRRPIQ
jgi:class 3 adenylate cyclase